MPGRQYAAGSGYRYGFNGKENDNEVKGEGNQQDYGMRIYDPRLGRFLSVDPLTQIYPWYTPYQFAGNKPIACIDLDGLEEKPSTNGTYEGQQQMTSVGKRCDPDAPGCDPDNEPDYKEKNWVWHTGGIEHNDGTKSAAGWYEQEDFNKVGEKSDIEIGWITLSATAIEKLGGLEKAQAFLKEGKFETIWNGQSKTWSLQFNGNQYVDAEWVSQEKLGFKGNVSALRWVKAIGQGFEVAGIIMSIDDMTKHGVTFDNSYNATNGIIALIPGGQAIALTMFLSKQATELLMKYLMPKQLPKRDYQTPEEKKIYEKNKKQNGTSEVI